MIDPELAIAVKSAIREAIAPIKADEISLAETRNFKADDVLLITVELPAGTGPLPAPSYMEMLRSVGHTLIKAGEERTPRYRTVRADDDEPLESVTAGHP